MAPTHAATGNELILLQMWLALDSKSTEVALMLKAIHAQEDKAAARRKMVEVAAKLRELRLAITYDKFRTL